MAETRDGSKPEISVNLKDPVLAAFLAWLIPGLGHLYQGRRAKAGLFFVCIMSTFLYGLYLGSDTGPKQDGKKHLGWGRVVYFRWRTNDKRLPYLCQVGIGLSALPALVQANRMSAKKRVFCGGLMAPPWIPSRDPAANRADPNHNQPTDHDLHVKLHRWFELGTAYTMIAGLLNILAVYDAWGGPVMSPAAKKEDEDEDEKPDDSPPEDPS